MATAAQKVYSHITKTPGVCSGKPCIDGTRIRVENVVYMHKQGAAAEEILEAYPDLNLAQVYAALSYYYEHAEQIDASLAEDATWKADYERVKADYLSRRPTK